MPAFILLSLWFAAASMAFVAPMSSLPDACNWSALALAIGAPIIAGLELLSRR